MIQHLVQMDEGSRRRATLMVIAVTGLLCYSIFANGPLKELLAAQTQYNATLQRQTEMDSLNLDLEQLRNDFDKARRTLAEMQRRCATPAAGAAFFEQLNAVAMAHALKPISASLSQPKRLFEDSAFGLGERVVLQQADVVVAGNFADIIDYLDELTSQQGHAFLSNLRILLPSGADPTLRACFLVGIVIDLSDEGKS